MEISNNMSNGLERFFCGETKLKKHSCERIMLQLNQIPQSIPDYCKNKIDRIKNEIVNSFDNANSKEFSIAIVGCFGVGKSSFINALLSEDRIPALFPNPVANRFIYGSKDSVVLSYETNGDQEMSVEQYKKFSVYSAEDAKEIKEKGTVTRFNGLNQCTIYTNSRMLKNSNLCIIDIPGLVVNKKTLEAIKGADIIIYLCSAADGGLSLMDMEFISEYLHPENPNFFLCINKKDLLTSDELQEVTSYVRIQMESVSINRLFVVSSLYQNFSNGFEFDRKSYNPNIDYAERSGFEEMVESISKCLKESRIRFLNDHLASIKEALRSLKTTRLQVIKCNILQIQNEIIKLVQKKDILLSEIRVIEMKYEKILSEFHLEFEGMKGRFVGFVESAWEHDMPNFRSEVRYSLKDYYELYSYNLNVFLSDQSKKEKAKEVLSPFINAMVRYVQSNLEIFLQSEESNIERLNVKLYEREGLPFTNQIIIPPITIYTMVEPPKMSDIVFEYIWDELTEKGVFFLSATALIEWCLGISESNKKVLDMLNAIKSAMIKEIDISLNDICIYAKDYYSQFINLGKNTCTKEMYQKLEGTNKEIKNLEQEIESLQQCISEEESYFDRTISAMILK